MFFNLRINEKKSDKILCFTKNTELIVEDSPLSTYIKKLFNEKLVDSEPKSNAVPVKKFTIKTGIPSGLTSLSENEEEYAVILGEETFIYGKNFSGMLFGVATLMQLKDFSELNERFIYDYPERNFRGYRIFIPGRENIGAFKDVIDFLVYYKYNKIILEVGGAMEYKSHPEINESWVEFCKEVFSYNGRADEIQLYTYPWEKDSIHCDNGDGGFLTQDEVRDLVKYCNERGIEVIPECPSFSHSDYIVIPHPELRERPNDDYADTYCPSNPDTYKLLFELLDEVIDVFNPKTINIGHDELYSIGVCPKCKDKDPVDIYIEDITKIKNYLNSKGINVYMWGEKLLKAVDSEGNKWAGWFDLKTRNGGTYQIPWLYPCAERMPEGLTFLHWYWTFDAELDEVYHSHGYPMIFGNLSSIDCKKFRERLDKGVLGGFASNWGCFKPEYMQRNNQYFDLICNAYALWSNDYRYSEREVYFEKMLKECMRRHYQGKKNLITVTHTTDLLIPYKFFHDGTFIDDDVYLLGNYRLTYTDGESVTFPVVYGTNLSNSNIKDPYTNLLYREVNGSAMPKFIGDEIYYTCMFENPYPEKEVQSFNYEPIQKANVYLKEVKFN